jgi:hypothetical protein
MLTTKLNLRVETSDQAQPLQQSKDLTHGTFDILQQDCLSNDQCPRNQNIVCFLCRGTL